MPRSGSADTAVVGLDDTDAPGIGGTGRLTRSLAEEIVTAGGGESGGVTRHQLFEGPGVPKTARNSAAAVTFTAPASDLLAMVTAIVERDSVPGSDPGVAVLRGSRHGAALHFARSAQQGLVGQAEARHVATEAGIALIGLGGTDDGIIGALSAAALRADGNDGRYVGLRGIRAVSGKTSVDEVLDITGIVAVVDVEHGEPLAGGVRLDVGQWVRPRLIGGSPVLVVRRDRGRWVNADTRPQ